MMTARVAACALDSVLDEHHCALLLLDMILLLVLLLALLQLLVTGCAPSWSTSRSVPREDFTAGQPSPQSTILEQSLNRDRDDQPVVMTMSMLAKATPSLRQQSWISTKVSPSPSSKS